MSAAPSLAELATAMGLAVDWEDVSGQPQRVGEHSLLTVLSALGYPAATLAQRREAMQLAAELLGTAPLLTARAGERVVAGAAAAACTWQHEDGSRQDGCSDAEGRVQAPSRPGYWTLACGAREQQVAVAPARCFGVKDALGADARGWGLVLQPYAARSEHDTGLGDTAACAQWARRAAAAGADALALGPVHAADHIDATFSPYSPGDRRYLDAVYAAPVDALGPVALQVLDAAPALRAEIERLRASTLIDWPAAAAAKWQWLALLEQQARQSAPAYAHELERFRREGGAAMAAHIDFMQRRHGFSPSLYLFGQWLVSEGWRQAHGDARAAGMRLGLIADLAVGFDPHGAEAEAAGDCALRGLTLGAPPDAFCAAGQSWGVSSYSPMGLVAHGFAPFIALLRSVMRDRGGVRIDHILGLQRLWVVPAGADAGQGVYLRYPLQDLLNLLAIESWRQRCIVIGEDLGVVPAGIRATLAERGVLGMDVLPFCRDGSGAFVPPQAWRRQAVAMSGTHDLPTLVGWRRGLDLQWRQRLGELDAAQLAREQQRRRQDMAQLDTLLPDAAGDDEDQARLAALELVATSVAPLALLPVEDALGLAEQVNLPGTVAVHPNWRQRLPLTPPPTLEHAMTRFADARSRHPA